VKPPKDFKIFHHGSENLNQIFSTDPPNEVEVHFIKTLENENSNFRSLLKFLGFPKNCLLKNEKIFVCCNFSVCNKTTVKHAISTLKFSVLSFKRRFDDFFKNFPCRKYASEFVWEVPLTQNFIILSMPLSFKYKFAEQKCNKICSTVKYVEQK
jgi:hypothetical protein